MRNNEEKMRFDWDLFVVSKEGIGSNVRKKNRRTKI
jgi:hypothetical protein